MNESRIDATDRLRREGRWEEASQFKDETKRRLRNEGETRATANEHAWEAMLEKYPPTADAPDDADEEQLPEISAADIEAAIAKGNSTLIADSQWVYENLANTEAKVSDAPSLGAWSLLHWARENSTDFYRSFSVKMLGPRMEIREGRELFATLAVDIGDPTCADEGTNCTVKYKMQSRTPWRKQKCPLKDSNLEPID